MLSIDPSSSAAKKMVIKERSKFALDDDVDEMDITDQAII
jgi:hypothetical protein